jgi:hypothetical protein
LELILSQLLSFDLKINLQSQKNDDIIESYELPFQGNSPVSFELTSNQNHRKFIIENIISINNISAIIKNFKQDNKVIIPTL